MRATARRRPAVSVGAALALALCLVLPTACAHTGPDSSASEPVPVATAGTTSSGDAADAFPVGIAFGDRLLGLSAKQVDHDLDDTVRIGATWIRIDMSWADLQPDGPGRWSLSRLDQVVQAASSRGLKVLGILTYTPAWARAKGCEVFTCPPADDRAFVTFASTLAARYAGRVTGYEIWNEPNIPPFWSTPDPAAYRALLLPTLAAVRRADPAATVITGGLAPNGRADGAIEAGEFLRALCGGGACAGVDGIGLHPYTYPHSPEQVTDPPGAWQRVTVSSPGVPSIESVLDDVGLGDKRIWVTEFGAPSGGPGRAADGSLASFAVPTDHVTGAWQAHSVGEAITLARDDPSVFGSVFIHTLDDYPPVPGAPKTKEDHFGLIHVDGSPKQSYFAFRSAATAPVPPS